MIVQPSFASGLYKFRLFGRYPDDPQEALKMANPIYEHPPNPIYEHPPCFVCGTRHSMLGDCPPKPEATKK